MKLMGIVLGMSLLVARVAHAADDDASLYKCKKLGAKDKITVSLKADTALVDLALWYSGFTCKTVVFGADVAKHATKITIVAPAEMTAKEAEALFVSSIEAQGLVVTAKGNAVFVKLGAGMQRGCPDGAAAEVTNDVAPVKPDPHPADDDAEAKELEEVTKHIKKIDDTHYEIDRASADKILAGDMLLTRGARIVPSIKDGKANGFKLYAIRPSSVYAHLGFMNGDTIVEVNGDALTSMDKALEIYTKVKSADAYDFKLLRRGKDVELVIKISK